MSEPFDSIIARSRAARARARELQKQLTGATAREAHAIADERSRLLRQLIEEGRNLHQASKLQRDQ